MHCAYLQTDQCNAHRCCRCDNFYKAYLIYLALTTSDESFADLEQQLASSGISSASPISGLAALPVAMFRDGSVRPNVRTFNTLLKGFRGQDAAGVDNCLRLIERMQSLGVKPNAVTINTVVDACVLAGNFTQAESVSYTIRLLWTF